VAGFAPLLAPDDPERTNVSLKLAAPSLQNYLGTDQLGRDVFSRMLYGSRVSLSVGFVAVAISILIGVLVGAVAGYYSGWVDSLLMRLVDIMLCFPSFFLILTVVALWGPSLFKVMVVIGITSWMGLHGLSELNSSPSERGILHKRPKLWESRIAELFSDTSSECPGSCLCYSYAGRGHSHSGGGGPELPGLWSAAAAPSWGNILTEGRTYIFDAWWLTVFPGLAILITVLAFNLLGEGCEMPLIRD